MFLWILFMGILMICCILGAVYLTFTIAKSQIIQKISGEKRWLSRLISFLLIAACFVLTMVSLSLMDAVVVFLHAVLFFIIVGIIVRIIEKAKGKEFKINARALMAVLVTVVYLSVGYYLCINVWKTTYNLSTDKAIGNVRVAVLSDSHMGTTFDGEGFAAHVDEIMRQEPDIILIPGDYVDDGTRREDMIRACEALGSVNPKYGVWFAYGNHDKGLMQGRDFSAADLEEALMRNNVHVLEDEIAYIDDFCIVGRQDAMYRDRAELAELLENVDSDKYIIVLDHEPNDYEEESKTEADLVVSGHTHGGQLIPLAPIGVMLGINDRSYGYEERNGTNFIVTSGISDWALHFKTGTKSEYVIIEIEGK